LVWNSASERFGSATAVADQPGLSGTPERTATGRLASPAGEVDADVAPEEVICTVMREAREWRIEWVRRTLFEETESLCKSQPDR
jgi:hypothetical protein